jgi:hypothetical protein
MSPAQEGEPLLRQSGVATPDSHFGSPVLPGIGADAAGPKLKYLPDSVWLAGLGHLGQAYAWTLGLLDYPEGEKPSVVLQDVDPISEANLSTSLLAEKTNLARRKTRIVSEQLVSLGFDVRVVDRRFDEYTRRQDGEPRVILSGFDNYRSRRFLGAAGFDRTVDAGLAGTYDRYRSIMVRSFHGPFDSEVIYKDPTSPHSAASMIAGYEREISDQIRAGHSEADARCGILEVAGKAMGLSFVGTVASAVALAEVMRPLHGGPSMDLVSVDLGNLTSATSRDSVFGPLSFPRFNGQVDCGVDGCRQEDGIAGCVISPEDEAGL